MSSEEFVKVYPFSFALTEYLRLLAYWEQVVFIVSRFPNIVKLRFREVGGDGGSRTHRTQIKSLVPYRLATSPYCWGIAPTVHGYKAVILYGVDLPQARKVLPSPLASVIIIP